MENLLRQDRQGRGFEIFFDPDRMKIIFQQRLSDFSQGRLAISDCRIGYTRYKTYKKPSAWDQSSLSVCYHLEIHDPSARKSRREILYAKAFLGDRSRIEFQKIKGVSSIPSACEEGILHFSELDMIVWAFPNDPVLLHLPECIHPEAVKRHLPYDRLPSGLNGPADISGLASEVVHYRPEVRCTTRYRLQSGTAADPKEIVVYGKTFNDARGEEIYQRMNALRRSGADNTERFIVAEPLAYCEEIKTVWQSGLDGDPFADVINERNYRSLLERAAGGLAFFHKSGLSSTVRITLDDHLEEIKKKIAKLIHAFPGLRELLQSIEHDLAQRIQQLLPVLEGIIHADFTVQQLLVCDGRIAFFDFDEFAIGDPAQDVANFMVDLHIRPFDRSLVEEMKVVFLRAYRRRSDRLLSDDRLHWHLQVQFVTKAYRIYIQQAPGLEKEIEAILSLAQKKITSEKV